MRILFFVSILFSIASCKKDEILLPSSSQPVRFMFQNGVGLNLQSAGCSILDLGGASRMCERVALEKPELLFQIGPAFSPLVPNNELTSEKAAELQKALIEVWNTAQVRFYSVDGLDLSPSLKSFEDLMQKRDFFLLSTNIRTLTGETPFKTLQKVSWGSSDFIFLSFTAEKPLTPPSDWQALPFKEALKPVTPILSKNPSAQLIVLGSLSPSERNEIATALERPTYFLGGTLEEENTTEWSSFSSSSKWGKAVDLGRGTGKIEWHTAPSVDLKSTFSSKALRKDLDAVNQCTKVVQRVLAPSR